MESMMFREQSDYTFHKFDGITAKNQSATQSLFNGSTITHSNFTEMDLSRCDIEGVIIQDAHFTAVNFTTADFRSNRIGKTLFNSCNFSDTFILNSKFSRCEFIDCLFTSAIMNNCNFADCSFTNCKVTKGTFTFIEFTNTKFKDMSWGDCSFYKNIVDECVFEGVWLNVDSLGQLYGLDKSIIDNLNYVFLGKKLGKMSETLYAKLPEIYKERGWKFDCIFLRYNMGELSTYEMILAMHNHFIDTLISNRLVKKDDLHFCTQVLNKLRMKKRLPLFALIESIDILNNNIKEFMTNQSKPDVEDIRNYIFNLAQMVQEMLHDFINQSATEYYGSAERVQIRIRYESPTCVDWVKNINEVFRENKHFLPEKATLLRIEQGSIVEVALITLASVFGFQFLLYGVNGVILQLLDLRAGIKTLVHKETPQSYIDRVLGGEQIHPPIYKDMMEIIKSGNLSSKMIKLAQKTRDASVITGTIKSPEEDSDSTE